MKKNNQKKCTIRGTIRLHARGFGFVIPDKDQECKEDVFIPKHLTKTAVDGDTVEVAVFLHSRKPEKGPEGEILSILERAHKQIVVIVTQIKENIVSAHAPILGEAKPVVILDGIKNHCQSGDRLLVSIVNWGDKKQPLQCHFKERLGHISDPSLDIDCATHEYELTRDFPPNVLAEVAKYGNTVSPKEQNGRLDLSKTPTFTIDPDTAKDFDDALSIDKNKKGEFFLGVHIADVAHYVKAESHLDKEAQKRGNSTYFPGECIPMLPEELSNHLCSLKQGVVRLTVSVLMHFDKEGTLLSSEVKRTFIKSKKRFTYDEAKQVLDGKKTSPYSEELHQMAQLCSVLKNKRNERGSIDFSLPELILLIDEKGAPTGIKIEEYHITHQLVEEFMLKANETVAVHLEKMGKGQLFRIHEEPSLDNLEEFYNTARSYGLFLPSKPTQQDLQKLFVSAKNTPFSHELAISFIRSLKLASYSPHNVGHYGLALEHYCHFTSPIRRYSDLITQRLLFDEEPANLDLIKAGELCSERERVSFKAEMSVRLLKKYRLLDKWHQENPGEKYEARITKIKPYGFHFEITKLFLEGNIHVSALENDYFIYNEKVPMLEGEKTKIRYKVGDMIRVVPENIDLIYLTVQWKLLRPKKAKKKKR